MQQSQENPYSEDYNYGDRLIESLEQALAYARGDKSKARVTVLKSPVPDYGSSDITKLRKALDMSRESLAYTVGVSLRTVEAWEKGKSSPSKVAARMLYLIENDPSLVQKLEPIRIEKN